MSIICRIETKIYQDSYLIILLSKDWLKHHEKSEILSVIFAWKMTKNFNHLGIADKKHCMYVSALATKKILIRKPMGITAKFYYFHGNRNFEGSHSWTINRYWHFSFLYGNVWKLNHLQDIKHQDPTPDTDQIVKQPFIFICLNQIHIHSR